MSETKKPRVAICVPSGDLIFADFAMCLVNIVGYSRGQGIEIGLINHKTSHIDMGRHALVKAARDIEADYIMFLDSDMVFPFNTIERLMSWDKDIVGASYVRRREPHGFVHTDLDGGAKEFKYGIAALSSESKGLREVARLPTGMMLIKMSVFDKVAEPWFDSRWNPASGQRISEDNAFCDDARKAGLSVWLDEILTGEIGHIGQVTYRPAPCDAGMQELTITPHEVQDVAG